MTQTGAGSSAPGVSVLLTTYNGARFIAETIESVLAQTCRDFELVVVDDNSADETLAIVGRYADPRLRVLSNPANLGVVGARNRGFRDLHGSYVATIDHDDLWLPTRLEAGLASLSANPNLVMVATQVLGLEDGRLSAGDRPRDSDPLLFRWMLLLDAPVVYSSLLFRRDTATLPGGDMLRPDLRYADDYELMLRLAAKGDVAALPEALTIYRLHGGNTTYKVADEMYQHAVTAVTEHLVPLLGVDAQEAARLIGWHIARRFPVGSRTELRRLARLLRQLMEAFIAVHRPSRPDQDRIELYTRQMYWRAVRATLRSGTALLAPPDLMWPREGGLPAGRIGDLAASIAVGGVRSLTRTMTRERPV